VILIFYVKRRTSLNLQGTLNLEIVMLSIATLVTLLIVAMGQIHVVVGFGLIGLYLIYLWLSSTKESEEPELLGPSLTIGRQSKSLRRTIVISLFVYSAFVILVVAEPFVHALVESGRTLGIDDFILIQWLAPLASESPEIIIAVLFSLRANPIAGITTLISAEVNQLTLLIGSMVGIFSLSFGELTNFPLNDIQSIEFILTAAVTFLGLIFLAPKIIGWKAGATLLSLFIIHLFFTGQFIVTTLLGYIDPGMWLFDRAIFTYLYVAIALCCGILYAYRRITRNG
jgi:cation:H+ antiporter